MKERTIKQKIKGMMLCIQKECITAANIIISMK